MIAGILFNVITSLAPRIPEKSASPKKYYLVGFIVAFHYLSFLFIAFAPGNKLINVGICLALHFLVNPLIKILFGLFKQGIHLN